MHVFNDKVLTYLRSTNWDTRIAAGQAVEAIVRNIPEWDPTPRPKEGERETWPLPHLDEPEIGAPHVHSINITQISCHKETVSERSASALIPGNSSNSSRDTSAAVSHISVCFLQSLVKTCLQRSRPATA